MLEMSRLSLAKMILFDDLLECENDFSARGAVGAKCRKIIFTRRQVVKQSFH